MARPDDRDEAPEGDRSHDDAGPESGVIAWARQRRSAEESALGDEGRILLALSLGLRARALAALGRR